MPQTKDDSRMERRSMEVRELRTKDDGKIAGYASVFNEETTIGGMFREVIKPGAFTRAIKEKDDVRALWNHDPNYVLGRTKSGTLLLKEDERGLWIEVDPPNTQFAADLMESIRRGDVDSMSFAFTADDETWHERKDDDLALREINSTTLYDISAVTYPAYSGTSVGLRSAESIYQDHVNSLEAQELPEEDDADRSQQELDRARAVVTVTKLKNNQERGFK